jgi:hypothetical protein
MPFPSDWPVVMNDYVTVQGCQEVFIMHEQLLMEVKGAAFNNQSVR